MHNLSSSREKSPSFSSKDISPDFSEEDSILDKTLRPYIFDEYIGQEKIKQNLKVIIGAAKKRKQSPDHILFYGGPGLGKTTLAYIIANEIGAGIKATSGPALEKPGDLVAILTALGEGEALFIDECHRMNKVCEEYLYSAMEDYKLNLILGKGPMARTMELPLPRFTLIAATTRMASLSSPLRSRFGAIFQLDFYNEEEIEKIILRSASILGVEIEKKAAEIIAGRSRFTPRVANRLLKRVRDFVQVEGKNLIDEDIAAKALDFLEIDGIGLELTDRKMLETIIKKFGGGPVGLQALAAAAAEEEDTILDIYEPYLMRLGFIERTPRGRVALEAAYEHLKIKYGLKEQQRML